jgi:predicted CXXCH cytochrome family protein
MPDFGPGLRKTKTVVTLVALLTAPIPLLLSFVPAILVAQQTPGVTPVQTAGNQSQYVGNESCGGCHNEIYQSYMFTAMARASGPATQNLITGEFQHKPSGVHYRVYQENGDAWLTFDRNSHPEVHGTRKLLYYIGSGHRGRTYLFSDEGFFFESPINWYAQKGVWDMAPAYQKTRTIPLNLPAVPACLRCHTSNAQLPAAGTEDKYALPLFAHAGITCERCHGPGAAHANTHGSIVNPAKLTAERRDSICMQCHLEGNAAVVQPGRNLNDFQPGQKLSETVHYFVLEGGASEGFRALSQTEALARSLCKRKTGDAMSCTSCHDPHSSPSPAIRVTFYREKCLSCHGGDFAVKHHAKTPDCTQCHMPQTETADIAHTQATDHSIPRLPHAPEQNVNVLAASAAPKLVRFPAGDSADSDRDLALAWQAVSKNSMSAAEREAEGYLRKAVAEARGDRSDDVEVFTALAYDDQKRKATSEARELYERALRLEPDSNDAVTNLGVIEAQSGHLGEAMALWEEAFERAPERSAIGLNLARGFCVSAQFDKARASVARVLEFNPDSAEARQLQKQLNANPPACGMR